MAGKRDKKGAARGLVIVRRDEVVGGGGHGGAWKVAYADFVTAMMAFFLLMWLLNATTEDQRKGLADYFSPNNLLSHASSGTGQPFGGHTAFDEGALVSDRGSVEITEGKRPPSQSAPDNDPQVYTQSPPDPNPATDPGVAGPDPSITDPAMVGQQPRLTGPAPDGDRQPTRGEVAAEKERQEKVAFEKAADEIRTAVHGDPELAELAKQLAIDMTPEGLRIQIMDEVKSPMFATGSAVPNDRARELLRKVAPILQKLPEAISIAGYTDATPYAGPGKTNWELSSERANATRHLLTDGGLADQRILTVTGHADRDPLLPGDPLAAANRRIAIVYFATAKGHIPPTPGFPPIPPLRSRRIRCPPRRCRRMRHPRQAQDNKPRRGNPSCRRADRDLAMMTIGAFVFLLICVFGSYLASGGSVAPLVEALPFEMWTIAGAAVGAFVMANSMHEVKHTIAGFGKILKGAVYKKGDYVELLSLMYYLVRLASTKGNMALEPHIEKPEESSAFQRFPKIVANHHACDLICDYLRLVGMNADDPNQIEDVMARELKKTLNEELHPAHALQSMADGLPALGIVAAVLGVIKTMSHIDQPPAILGAMIGGAMTGTFLGVLLSYGMVGPLSSRLQGVVQDEAKYMEVIRAVIVTHLHGNAPQVSIESGRKMVPNEHMPSFAEMEAAIEQIKV